jgi:hypothetical protein
MPPCACTAFELSFFFTSKRVIPCHNQCQGPYFPSLKIEDLEGLEGLRFRGVSRGPGDVGDL